MSASTPSTHTAVTTDSQSGAAARSPARPRQSWSGSARRTAAGSAAMSAMIDPVTMGDRGYGPARGRPGAAGALCGRLRKRGERDERAPGHHAQRRDANHISRGCAPPAATIRRTTKVARPMSAPCQMKWISAQPSAAATGCSARCKRDHHGCFSRTRRSGLRISRRSRVGCSSVLSARRTSAAAEPPNARSTRSIEQLPLRVIPGDTLAVVDVRPGRLVACRPAPCPP